MLRVTKILALLVLLPSLLYAAAPAILYTDITSGPNSGWGDDSGNNKSTYGCYLSIFGNNFGSNINAVTVTVGGGAVARNVYLGTSNGRPDVQQLSVQLGSSCATGNIVVTVGSESGTAKDTLTGDNLTFTVRTGSNVYFLSTSGSNATGTVDDVTKPYRTFAYIRAILAAKVDDGAGDFVCFLGGTWDLDAETLENSSLIYITGITGTLTEPLTIYGHPNNQPTIQYKTSGDSLFKTNESENPVAIVLANMVVSMLVCDHSCVVGFGAADQAAICTGEKTTGEATYCRAVNIKEDGGGTYGWCGTGGDYAFALGYTSHCKFLGVSVSNGGINDLNTPNTHMFYFLAKQHESEMGYCYIYNVRDTRAAVQVHMDEHDGACTGKVLTDIYIHDNYIDTVGREAFLADGRVGDVYYWNNIIDDACTNDVNGTLGMSAIQFKGGGGVMNVVFYNNTIYSNSGKGTASVPVITFGTSDSVTGYVQSAILKNNIVYATDSGDTYTGLSGTAQTAQGYTYITGSNNLWYGSSSSAPTFGITGQLNEDPHFTTNGSDFTLQSDSPCKDAGTDLGTSYDTDFLGGSRPYNSIWDMGAYEYGATPSSTPTSPTSVNVIIQNATIH